MSIQFITAINALIHITLTVGDVSRCFLVSYKQVWWVSVCNLQCKFGQSCPYNPHPPKKPF